VKRPDKGIAPGLTPAPELILCFALVFTVSCGSSGESASEVRASTNAIQGQIAKYTAALDAADINLASQVWLTSPEVSFLHPAGHQHGWEQVKDIYTFFGSSFSERKLTVGDVSVHVNGGSAWAEFYWHFDAKQRSNGTTIQTDGRETQVYRRIGDRWRLVHVHYSGPPMGQ
jgi:ketosteroid isomerase-like protein